MSAFRRTLLAILALSLIAFLWWYRQLRSAELKRTDKRFRSPRKGVEPPKAGLFQHPVPP
jgi:hypothetical protein